MKHTARDFLNAELAKYQTWEEAKKSIIFNGYNIINECINDEKY